MSGSGSEASRQVLALFKQFLAQRWFGGADFDTWVRQHSEHAESLRLLRDRWLSELEDPDSGAPIPGSDSDLGVATALEAGRVIAGFRLVKRIGSGAAGEVWKAEELALGQREVALKLLRPDLVFDDRSLERFRNEALAAAHVRHPGIVSVYSIGRFGAQPYIAMELLEGGTLATWLERVRVAGTREHELQAVALVKQAAEALAAVHDARILHRDVKPGNLLLGLDGRVKVADFGLARILDEVGISETGDVMGTPAYMSPEQMRGEVHQLDGRTDVFSLGATLYELVSLRRPFVGKTYPELAREIQEVDPPLLRRIAPEHSPDLELVCATALEKDRAHRYASMQAFAIDLGRFLAGEAPLARPAGTVRKLRKWARRHPLGLAVTGVVLVSSLGFGWYRQVQAAEKRRLAFTALQSQAELTIELGNLERARELVLQAEVLEPHDATGWLTLASGYSSCGRMPELEEALERARAMGFDQELTRPDSALEHQARGLYLQSQRDFSLYPEAERHLLRALELDDSRHGVLFSLYQMRVALGNREGAREALGRYQGHVPAADPFHDVLDALLLELDGNYRGALQELDALRERADLGAEDLVHLRWARNAGRLCVRLGEAQRAEELLKEAVAEAPGDCWSWDALAALYLQRLMAGATTAENLAAAREAADRASACSPSLHNPHLVRAWIATQAASRGPVAEREERRAEARAELAALANAPASVAKEARRLEAFLLELEASSALEARQFEKALELNERALELDPDDLRAAEGVGQCSFWVGRHREGLAVIEEALAKWDDPDWAGDRAGFQPDGLIVWGLGHAFALAEEAPFRRASERLRAELELGRAMNAGNLLNAAEFLATAQKPLQDCDLALELLDLHGVRRAFEATQAETIRKIEMACD